MLKAEATPVAQGSRFAECAGLRCVASGPNRATVLLEVSPVVLADDGGVHRGAVCALVEAAGTAAVGQGGEPLEEVRPGPVDLFVSFIRPAPEQPLTADAHVVRRERGVSVCDVEVRDWDRELVAKAVFTHRS
jgi:uncharacterized protein (TIGR00369 family)